MLERVVVHHAGDARGTIEAWRLDYNTQRPHSSLGDRTPDETQTRRSEHHWAMREKYLRAARYPWLPVAPDPPEPE